MDRTYGQRHTKVITKGDLLVLSRKKKEKKGDNYIVVVGREGGCRWDDDVRRTTGTTWTRKTGNREKWKNLKEAYD